MHWWQKALSWLSRIGLRIGVLLGIATVSLVALVGSPDTVKTFVKNSGAYDVFTDRILDETAKLDTSENTVPVNDPQIRELANQTFTPDRLEEILTKITDGTYSWLNGEVPQPDFVLDLSAEKRAIARGVSNYAKERVATLPTCTQLPATTDPFELECRPPGVDLDAEARKIERELLRSDDFLPDTTITVADIEGLEQQNLDNISGSFQFMKQLPFIFLILSIVSAIGVVLTCQTKRGGFERVGRSLLSSGLFMTISVLVFGKLLPSLSPSLKAQFQDGSFAGILNNIALQAVDLVVRQTLVYGGIVIGLALLIFIGLRLTNKPKVIKPAKA